MGSVDSDKPFTWVKYRDSLCANCIASCCMLPVEVKIEDLVLLGLVDAAEAETGSAKKIAQRLQKQKIVKNYRSATKLFLLEQKHGRDCVFLDTKSRQCTVYEKRPAVCRKFPTEMGLRLSYCPFKPKERVT